MILALLLGPSLAALTLAPSVPTSVTLVRDQHGVPHAFSASHEPAFYAIGYAAAEDRLLQMEFNRRLGRGTLSAVLPAQFTTGALLSDRRMRLFGLGAHADSVAQSLATSDAFVTGILDAYREGVNDYVASLGGAMPAHLQEVGFTSFAPWQRGDCLLMWYLWQDRFDTSWENEISGTCPGDPFASCTSTTCTPGDAIDVSGAVVPNPPAGAPLCWIDEQLDLQRGLRGSTEPFFKASHCWVVSGDKTTSGKPALCGEPRLPFQSPSLWYEFHVQGGEFDVRGIGFAGCPAMLVGWNRDIAWAGSGLSTDVSDLFEIKMLPPTQLCRDRYELDCAPTCATNVHNETITVGGANPHTEQVKYVGTVFGPLVTQYLKDSGKLDPSSTRSFALANQLLRDTDVHTVQGLLDLMRASSWCEARTALHRYRGPGLHWIYADASGEHGQIGYTTLGAVPKRRLAPYDCVTQSSGCTTVQETPCWGSKLFNGACSASNWQGTIPFDDMPWILDPAEGYLLTGNNLAAPPLTSYGGLTFGFPGDTLRSFRLRTILSTELAGSGTMTPAEVAAMHSDRVNQAVKGFVELAELMYGLGVFDPDGTPAHEAMEALLQWNDPPYDVEPYASDPSNPIFPLIHSLTVPLVGFHGQGVPALRCAYCIAGGQAGLCKLLKLVAASPATYATDLDAQTWVKGLLAAAWNTMQPVDAYFDVPYQLNKVAFGPDCPSGSPSLVCAHEFTTGRPMHCIDGDTVWSPTEGSYSQFVDLDYVESSRSLLSPGTSEVPGAFLSKNREAAWITGALGDAPLDQLLVETNALSSTVLAYP